MRVIDISGNYSDAYRFNNTQCTVASFPAVVCGTEQWVVYQHKGGEVGLAMYASTHESALPIDKLWILEVCTDFVAVQVVHFESSDKHEPSVTLRVALHEQKLT